MLHLLDPRLRLRDDARMIPSVFFCCRGRFLLVSYTPLAHAGSWHFYDALYAKRLDWETHAGAIQRAVYAVDAPQRVFSPRLRPNTPNTGRTLFAYKSPNAARACSRSKWRRSSWRTKKNKSKGLSKTLLAAGAVLSARDLRPERPEPRQR